MNFSFQPMLLRAIEIEEETDHGNGLEWIWDGLQNFLDGFSWGHFLSNAFDDFFQTTFHSFADSIKIVLQAVVLNPRTILNFSFVNTLYRVMLAAGAAILILIVVWQTFKSMFSWAGFQAEEPWRIAVKAIGCGFCLFYSKEILIWSIELNWRIIDLIMGAENAEASTGSIFSAIFAHFDFGRVTLFSIDTILLIYLIFKIISCAFKMVERLLLSVFLVILSPLAFATGASDSTKGFLQGFVRVFVGNLITQIIQVSMLCAIIIYQREASASANFPLNYLAFFILIGIFKLFGKIEEIVRDMSISVGIGVQMGGGAMQKVSSAVYTTQSITNIIRSFGGG